MDNSSNPLRVALHGMDARSSKMMAMYLHGPCKGAAIVVANENADVDIFDADSVSGQQLLKDNRANASHRPTIALSLNALGYTDVIAVKKPVKTDDMLAALAKAKTQIQSVAETVRVNPSAGNARGGQANSAALAEKPVPVLKQYVLNRDDLNQASKHQAAMQLSEKSFGAFIGSVSGLDVNDPKQFHKAHYNPKDYFQGHVALAFAHCRLQGHEAQLNSGWIPLIIFPKSHEVWLDADDNPLRSFSGLAINKSLSNKIALVPLSPDLAKKEKTPEKFHSMDAFLWKIACWASKGRYPESLDINQPVYLKHWPNFTRLLVTPHALRIAALLVQGPRTLPNIAESLNIKPQYVFVFISAACALGLAGQAQRQVDTLVDLPEDKPSKNKGILGRILSKLLGR